MFPALVRAQRTLPRLTLPQLGTGLLLGCLAFPTVLNLTSAWRRHPDYDFAWLLAPVVVWFLVRSQPWRRAGQPHVLAGVVTLSLGGVLHLGCQVITWPLLDFAAWLLMARGCLLALWGPGAVSRAMPVLLLAFFLFPLPLAWLNTVAHWMQELVSQLAGVVLSLFWVCHQQGNRIHLAGLDVPLSVAVECSGIRQLLVFVAFASVLALYLPTRGGRFVLIAAAFPVAVLANVLRVITLAILARVGGPEAIHGVFHDTPLILSLPLGALALWYAYCRLKSTFTAKDEATIPPGPLQCTVYRPFLSCLGALVLLQVILQVHLRSAPSTSPVMTFSLAAIPDQLGPWRGQSHPEASKLAAQATFADETLTRIYSDDRGHAVAVYLVFSQTGRDREHHPDICLRDIIGARELPSGRQAVLLSRGQAQRSTYQRGMQRTTVYYWHYTVVPSRQGVTFLQSLYLRQHERLPSLTVQVQTNVADANVWRTVEATFLSQLDRALQDLLPPNPQVGYDRLPIRMVAD
jgi:EpsI family protein